MPVNIFSNLQNTNSTAGTAASPPQFKMGAFKRLSDMGYQRDNTVPWIATAGAEWSYLARHPFFAFMTEDEKETTYADWLVGQGIMKNANYQDANKGGVSGAVDTVSSVVTGNGVSSSKYIILVMTLAAAIYFMRKKK